MNKNDYLITTNIVGQKKKFNYYSLPKLSEDLSFDLQSMPYSLRVLLENLIRNYDNKIIDEELIKKFIFNKTEKFEIPLVPLESFYKILLEYLALLI